MQGKLHKESERNFADVKIIGLTNSPNMKEQMHGFTWTKHYLLPRVHWLTLWFQVHDRTHIAS